MSPSLSGVANNDLSVPRLKPSPNGAQAAVRAKQLAKDHIHA